MTYILRTTHGEFEQTRTFATAADAIAAIDAPSSSPTVVTSIDRMGDIITEAELRRDAQQETSRDPLRLPDVKNLT